MQSERIPHEQVHKDLDAHYFADYAMFTGVVRMYVARTLEQTFSSDRNHVHRRLCVIGLYKEEFAAYEDLGAFIESMIRWRSYEIQVPFEGMLRYKDDKVALAALFNRRKISNRKVLFETLHLGEMIPSDWKDLFPEIDCRAGLVGISTFIAVDCVNNQKQYGIEAYNRIKHGLALFPNGRRYASSLPDCPAVIINNREPNSPNPYTLMAMPMDDSSIQQRAKIVEFVQASIRCLAAFYVISRYPGYFAREFRIGSDSQIFSSETMTDVIGFFAQIAKKYANEEL